MDLPSLLIVSDDRLTRAGLTAVLSDVVDLRVVGDSDSHVDPVELLDLYQPDVVLWDLGWDPELRNERSSTPLERLAALAELDIPVVVLLPEGDYAGSVWRMGVHALLPRAARVEMLAAAIHAAAVDLRVLDPQLAADLMKTPAGDGTVLAEPLTPREEEVLALLAEGLTNRAIGRALTISENTAKFHVQALMGKLGAQSRTEAVVRATRLGLLSL